MSRVDRTVVRGIMLGEKLQLEMGEFRTEEAMQILNLEYFKDKMMLMQAQENGVVLNEEQLLFIAGGQTNTFDDDVDEALTIFMANLSSADPIYDEVGPSYDSDILFEYVKDNAVQVVQSNVSSVPNDALMMIINDMHEQAAQCVSADEQNKVVNESLTAELARYKEQVELYEKRARFELTEREQKIDEQLRIISLTSMIEEVTTLKNDFKQKENKYLEDFLDMKALKEKVEDKLFKQDQSLQTVHMLCTPKPYYDEKKKVAIGYKNPLYLTSVMQVQSALYNGHEIVKTNHAPAVMHDSEDTLELVEITRKRMLEKVKSPLCVEKKVRIAPPDYSKENYLATFTRQRHLTPEQIFWSSEIQCLTLKPMSKMTVRGKQTKECYLTKVIPFFKTLKEHFEGIQAALIKEVKEMKEIFEQKEAKVEQNAVDMQCADIERKNLLIENENLIADCLSHELLYSVMNDVNTVSRFFEMHDAYTIEQARCLELKAEISKLKHKIQKDDHSEMIKCFSNLEFLKSTKSKESLQGKDNTIRKLKAQISQMNEKRSEADQQNELFRAKNAKIKRHYKELYNSIKITRAKTIEKITSLLTENEKLKAQLKGKMQCVTMPAVKPKVLAPETLREIVEEARIEKALDNALEYACFYTKRSQELLEYVIDTCPKEFSKRDKKVATTPLNRNKQWKPTRRKFTLGEQCPLTRFTKSKVVPSKQPEHVSSSEILITERFSNTSQKPLTRYKRRTDRPLVFRLRLLKTYDGESLTAQEFHEKFIGTVRFGNDHFGAIVGYGDYMSGDSVISKVYYVEGHGHNLFSVGQFCNSNLEVAFRKHSCYVRDVDGVELLKGSRGSNLYTISVEDMMKSSLICLLSKASKNKSWLWHRRLNHLNFDTIDDLAQKDLFVIKFLKQIQVGLNKTVRYIRTDNGKEFDMKVSTSFTKNLFRELLSRTAEVVATACYTQNRSLIHTRHNKTPYELVHDKKPDLKFL
ncbi:integrase, catalytic region, zinc finger, CCHC-type containing protein [Tanacetum coccineum]